MQPRYKIDHICTGCGARAVAVPAAAPEKGSVVMVPHQKGCPVALRVVRQRQRAKTGGKR